MAGSKPYGKQLASSTPLHLGRCADLRALPSLVQENALQHPATYQRTPAHETTKAPASARASTTGGHTMHYGAKTLSGEDRVRTNGTNAENEQDSVLIAAKSAAADAENRPLDPQLQLLDKSADRR